MADGAPAVPTRRRGIRSRVTLVATSIVAMALIVAAVSMAILLRRTLTDNVRADAFARAEAAVQALGSGNEPDLDTGDDAFVQVVAADGRVLVSSQNMDGRPAATDLEPGESSSLDVPFDDDPFMVVARGAGDGITVLTGHALDAVEESIAALTVMLVLGIPLLTVAIGWLVWVMVGRALRPIEAIRSEVDGIGHGELERRVPVAPSDDEVARLAATMNSMLERLEQGQARERRFVSDASHELRSPVATIRQQAELALAHPEGASLNELAENVLAEDLRIQRIVEDLLMLARMDEGAGTITRSAIDLDDTVLNEVKRLENAGVAIDASRVSGGRVAGDPRQLERLVGNLLDNAVRHARGKVSVGLVESDGVVLLTVDDDGPGIPAAERVRVFDRFVRLEGARDRGSGGAGLGLAIVAEVASAHGGRAAVEGSQLGGARVEVRLPRSA